jgi:hypothetical protein
LPPRPLFRPANNAGYVSFDELWLEQPDSELTQCGAVTGPSLPSSLLEHGDVAVELLLLVLEDRDRLEVEQRR